MTSLGRIAGKNLHIEVREALGGCLVESSGWLLRYGTVRLYFDPNVSACIHLGMPNVIG